ncbi:ATP synthase subunit I [Agaribacter flavus]|uniref:ATP synthase subunit I n=1 Tax=Agaribacter flavus TaxID=1902781 RepID=A0ABV7FP01_9ALTE
MQSDLAANGKNLAIKGLAVQFALGFTLIIICALFWPEHVSSVALGVISFVLPHSIFAYWIFRYAGASKNQLVVRSLSQGMKIKLALTSIIFTVAFSTFSAHPLFLLGAYAMITLSQWLAMFWFNQQ